MTLYDPDNPQHLAYLAQHRARWSREKEEALQRSFVEKGMQTEEQMAAKMRRYDEREANGN